MYKIKIGILGCSSIAEKCIIPAIKKIKKASLSGVASRNKNKAIAWGIKHETKPYTYEELLLSDVDVIYISLPPGLHYKWGKKVLLSGKHLLMEKTFTTNLQDAIELFNIAKLKNLKCMEALMYEFHPVQNKIDGLLEKIGDVKHLDASFCFPHFTNKANIRYNKSLGGGSIYDSLIYPLSFVHRILGKNYKDCYHYFIENDVIERGTICLTYPNAIANINFGFGQAYRNEIAISGAKKTIKAKRVFSRTPDSVNPIHLISNDDIESLQINKSDQFENMISFFMSASIKTLYKKELNTISRLKFMDKIAK
jgi:predicted dehydrogenase